MCRWTYYIPEIACLKTVFIFILNQKLLLMKRTFVCLCLLSCIHAGYSQDTADTSAKATTSPSVEVAGIKITGSVDFYYRYNFANAKDSAGNPITNNYTSFTNSQNSFELGMASIQASQSFGKASAF